MFLLTCPLLLLLLSLDSVRVLPGTAELTQETCNTTEDSLYIIVDSSSNINLTFKRIKNFVQYFISKTNNFSLQQIAVIEPFQKKVLRFSIDRSTQEIFVPLDQFQAHISLNKSIDNNISTLIKAVSFTNAILNTYKTDREQSVIVAWFSVCYGNCKKTIQYFEEFSLESLARQFFLFLPSIKQDSRNLFDSFVVNQKFIYILLFPLDYLSDNNVISLYICNECPLGWIRLHNEKKPSIINCYKIILSPFPLIWNDASKQCRMLFSDLPIIETNEELQFLITLFNDARNDVLPESVETIIVYVGLTKSKYIDPGVLQWTNERPFLFMKNIESKNDNNKCAILKYSNLMGIENGSIRASDQISWELIDCKEEITKVILCKMALDKTSYELPEQFDYKSQRLGKKKLPLNNEFIFKESNEQMISIAHYGYATENIITDEYKQLLFDCENGLRKSIVYSKVCNTFNDCMDDSDEQHCEIFNLVNIKKKDFLCKNPNANEFFPVRKRYDLAEKCNAHQDCPDNSDEEMCHECKERRCSDGTCVPRHWLSHDGDECRLYINRKGTIFINVTVEFDAATKQHEIVNCNQLEKIESVTTLTNNTETDKWAPKCIFLRGRSGGITGCNDLSHLQDCVNFICTEEFIKCHQSYCIPYSLINNGVMDCPHGEDETISGNMNCPFACSTYGYVSCVHYVQVCDGVVDCPAGDDEINCNFTCHTGFKCYGSAKTVNNISEVMKMTSLRIFDIQTKYLNLNGLDLSQLNEIYILPNLLELHASDCNLESLEYLIPRRFDMNVIRLDLSYNKFIQININDAVNCRLPYLAFLNLTRNIYLSSLNGDLKSCNLDLSYTNLSLLNIEYQTYSHTLRYLNLSNTKIESLGTMYKISSLEVLDIRNTTLPEKDTMNILKKLNITSALYTENVKYCCPQVVGKGITKHVCHATFDSISSCEDLIGDIFKRSLLWLVTIISMVGNIMVLSFRIYYDREILKKGYGVFVTNLGISDFVMGTYLTIIVSADFYFRDNYVLRETNWRASILCKISGFLSTLSSEASTFFVFLITLDRFLVIRFPFGEYRLTKLIIILLVLTSWVVGFTLALLPIVYPQWTIYSSNGMCLGLPLTTDQQQGWQYAVGIFIVFNCILFLAISLGQVLIFLSMTNQRMTKNTINSSRREQDIQVAKQLFIVALSNFLCWFPICVTGLLSMKGHKVSPDTYAWFVIFILPLNSALNPLIYTIPVIYKKWREFNVAKHFKLC